MPNVNAPPKEQETHQIEAGKHLLAHPILPLVRIVFFLYLTGPFKKIESLVEELIEPVEIRGTTYDTPRDFLLPYLPALKIMEAIKKPAALATIPEILNQQHEPANQLRAVELWAAQQTLTMELERINSLLCGPQHCILCCTGPDSNMTQHFFEIPLTDEETKLFNLEQIDNPETRKHTAMSEPSLTRNNKPFYENDTALYRWRSGWSMILSRETACPQLDPQKGTCRIYPQRPEVCRKPQIFSYVLEKPEATIKNIAAPKTCYLERNKMLAVWDCPYVRKLKEEIANYAELSELTPIFMENKD